MLPRQAEEVEAGRLRHAALVHDAAVLVEHRDVDPRVVDAEAGCPDDGADVELGAVGEAHRRSGGVDGSAVELDAVRGAAPRGLEPISVSSRFCIRWPIREAVVLRMSPVLSRYQNRSRPEDALGQRRLARADRQMHLVGAGELLGDLKARVAATDDEHAAFRDGPRRPIAACCAAGRPPGRGARRSAARTAPGTGRWRRPPGRPRTSRSSSSTR